MLRTIALCLGMAISATTALAGANPVIPAPDAPIAVPSVSAEVGASVVALLGPIAGTSAVTSNAITTITQSPGSPAALAAIGSLSVAVSEGITSGSLSLPAMTATETSQAVAIIDQIIAGLASSGVSTAALASIRDAIVAAQKEPISS